MEWVQIASNFGFPAMLVIILFLAYRQLVEKVVSVVEANTEANRAQAEAYRAVCDRLDKIERRLGTT